MTTAPRSRWWIAPAVSTLLTLPTLALGALITMFVGFAFDSCSGGCPRTNQHVLVAFCCLLTAAPLLAGAWLAARSRSIWHAVLCVLAPAMAALAVVSYATIPMGQ